MDDSNQIRVMWFAYDWDDRFHYFPNQAEAISWVESQIPLHFDDDEEEWSDDISYLRVGCITHKVKSQPNKDRDYPDYKLVPVLD
jgi:hypothetical protein